MDNVIAFPFKQEDPSTTSFIQALCRITDWAIEKELPDPLTAVLVEMSNDPTRAQLIEARITQTAFETKEPNGEDINFHSFSASSTFRQNVVPQFGNQAFKDFLTLCWSDTTHFPQIEELEDETEWVAQFTREFAEYDASFPDMESGAPIVFCLKFMQAFTNQPELKCAYGGRSDRLSGSILEFTFYEKLDETKGRVYTLFIDFLPFVLDDAASKLIE